MSYYSNPRYRNHHYYKLAYEFFTINAAVYSDMQHLWDKYKFKSKMNLLLSGSVYSLMNKIFMNSKEALFGRADERIHLKPFSIDTIVQIYKDFAPKIKAEEFLAFYTITGGVPKYIALFYDKKCWNFDKMIHEIFRENSLLLEEGRNILIEEFAKDYYNYFSILALIASSKTSRSEMESILEKNIGGFLERLEKDYQLIKKVRPVFSKPGGKNVKYEIVDNFLSFWFRFIYKYRSAVEIENFNYLRTIVKRDFAGYSGSFLEKYFHEKMAQSGKYHMIGRYWERGNLNEIDLLALNELDKNAELIEIKRNKKNLT